jgi:hypothetical protein
MRLPSSAEREPAFDLAIVPRSHLLNPDDLGNASEPANCHQNNRSKNQNPSFYRLESVTLIGAKNEEHID